jgi:hypothetical protein
LALLVAAVVSVGLGSCATTTLPPGYESLRTEASLAEGSKYILALRDTYIQARQQGKLTPAQFTQAVKADESLKAVWNQYVEAVRVRKDSAALWSQVIRATGTLENLLMVWLPGYSPTGRPAVLGK